MSTESKSNNSAELVISQFRQALERGESPDLKSYVYRVSPDRKCIERLIVHFLDKQFQRSALFSTDDFRELGVWAIDFAKVYWESLQGISINKEDTAESDVRSKLFDTAGEIPSIGRVTIAQAEMIGRYRIDRKIGGGGMGSVYQAWDTVLDRHVALKVPHFAHDLRSEVVSRFFREAKAMATLNHPNLCQVYDFGEWNGVHFITMAFLQGRTLAEVIAKGELQLSDSLNLLRTIALALHEAHKAGVIHRDLKPANVMIDTRGTPIVIDFGLARGAFQAEITHSNAIVGTPAYMSPEQAQGEPFDVGPRSDIYSLGTMCYLMLSGHLPFSGSGLGVLSQIQRDVPTPLRNLVPTIPADVEALCMKCLEKDPNQRYQTMAELANAIEDLSGSSVPAIDRNLVQEKSRKTLSPAKKYDVFISYAPIDNQPPRDSSDGWVSSLIEDLAWRLCQLNGRADEISFAISHDPIHDGTSTTRPRYSDSAIVLLVNSPGYMNAIWNRQEMVSFRDECLVRQDSVLVVERDRLFDLCDSSVLQDKSFRFWTSSAEEGVCILDSSPSNPLHRQRYFAKLDDLARKIYEKLRETVRPSQSLSSISDRQRATSKPEVVSSDLVVFLAEVTDDIDSDREQVSRFLEQSGYRVVPESWLPRSPEEFTECVREDLKKSHLFVQLLSEFAGRTPRGKSESYVATQARLATELGVPTLQWRSVDCKIGQVKDVQHLAMVSGPRVQCVPLIDFKREIQNQLMLLRQKRLGETTTHDTNDQPFIFINVDISDSSAVTQLCELLDQSGYAYALPLSSGRPDEIMKDLEDNLIECDGLVIVYGDIPGQWVREQLRLWRRLLIRRQKPLRALAIYEGPPSEKSPIGMSLPKMQIIDCRNGLEPKKLQQFIDQLVQRS